MKAYRISNHVPKLQRISIYVNEEIVETMKPDCLGIFFSLISRGHLLHPWNIWKSIGGFSGMQPTFFTSVYHPIPLTVTNFVISRNGELISQNTELIHAIQSEFREIQSSFAKYTAHSGRQIAYCWPDVMHVGSSLNCMLSIYQYAYLTECRQYFLVVKKNWKLCN
jgi:hypothetical protein